MRKPLLVLAFLLLAVPVGFAQPEKPLLLQRPTLSRTLVAFSYAGDLWTVPREGGDARRLTTGVGTETDPQFSPDGQLIAFTGEYDGNVDVYVVPASGGVPRRLTYHPAPDNVVCWTPGGKGILFRSARNSYSGFNRLFTIPVEGGFPTQLDLPMGEEGSYSPDGSRLAYVPTAQWQAAWKRYRGGQTKPIWIISLADAALEPLPRDNSNDFNPLWVGEKVYFLSDREGPVTLFVYDTGAKKVSRVLENYGLDLKSASAGPGGIVYEQFGTLGLLDLESGKARKLAVRITGDMPELRPRYAKVSGLIRSAGLSPTGARAVFQARGEVFTVPAEKGDVRNLTNTPGVAERDPAWSPDGQWIAYFSDASGEYELHLREQSGKGEVRKIRLGAEPSFYYSPTWSPDSKKIALSDKQRNLWVLEVESRRLRRVDTDTYDIPSRLNPVWSPDSRWLAYNKLLDNHMSAVFLYSLSTGKAHQVTDGMSDAGMAAFDRSGKYLYFSASTDLGPSTGWLDMSSMGRSVTRSVYVAVLRKELPSPLAPESDEEKVKEPEKKPDEGKEEPKKEDEAKEPAKEGETARDAKPAEGAKTDQKDADKARKEEPERVRIDLEGIGQRILALPIPARNYVALAAGKEGALFLLEAPQPAPGAPPSVTLHKFDLAKRKVDRVMEGLNDFSLAASGEKMLFRQGGRWAIQPVDGPKPAEGTLKLDGMEVRVQPQAEWKQMYDEVWRSMRDFFYDPGLHGLDLPAVKARYAAWLEGVCSRSDLNYLFNEMLGELTAGHIFVAAPGDNPEVRRVPGGLLGADYRIENGRYRFARIYSGENWNPDLRAPLTEPGVNVAEGEYLLAVNGRDVKPPENLYSFFEATAENQVVLKVGPNPDGQGSREVTVVPVASDQGLRHRAWIDGNRRLVDKLSGGKLAYVYLPNTSGAGYANFNRYYFAQVGKQGAVIDERFNGGGSIADYIVDLLRRPLTSYWAPRHGKGFTTPIAGIFGPKAMIINQWAGSGGDAMPWMFRRAGLGPLVGKRTWGGLVGMTGNPDLIDGGYVTVPTFGFYNPEGQWEIENHGVDPDIEVELDPASWRAGRDPQLEKAVEVVLAALEKNPLQEPRRPAYPRYSRISEPSAASAEK